MRLLYLDLDTLRPDHLGCYGYHRATSPNIDRIASGGMRFDQFYCSDAPCLPSRTALMTGRFGIHTGVVGHGGTAADHRLEGPGRGFSSEYEWSSLPRTLRKAGFYTALISPFAERHSSFTFYAGFREMHNTGKGGMESAEEITPVALDWIRRNAKRDQWYLHVNYWDPHTPYRAPAAFGNPFANDPLPAWITPAVFEQHLKHVGPHSANEIMMWDDKANPQWPRHPGALRNMQDLRQMIDGYDCGIRYMDDHIGQLLRALADEGVLDDLVIVVSADHGENQGELGIYGEHATADNITCRIPMIVRWPGQVKGGSVQAGLHYNLDWLPTLAEMLGQERHRAWDGESFTAALNGDPGMGRDHLVISQCCHVCQRSVRFDRWLYMQTVHDGFHLFPREMLFDLETDPNEQVDLAGQRPEVRRKGAMLLDGWHSRMMATMPAGYSEDPLETVMREGGPMHARGQLAAYCERLKATGRGWAVEELRLRHPGEFKD